MTLTQLSIRQQASVKASETPLAKPLGRQTYAIADVLEDIAHAIRHHDQGLAVSMHSTFPGAAELLERILPIVWSSRGARDAPVTARRSHAVPPNLDVGVQTTEVVGVANVINNGDNATAAVLRSQPIYTQPTLDGGETPLVPSAYQTELLPARYADVVQAEFDPAQLRGLGTAAHSLPSVHAKIRIARLGSDNTATSDAKALGGIDCLWHAGAPVTLVSDDLATGFAGKVHASLLMTLSNAVVQLETVALIVPRASMPGGQSGVVLGQRGVIDCMQYMSIPRALAQAQCQDVGDECWGRIDVKSYMTLDTQVAYITGSCGVYR